MSATVDTLESTAFAAVRTFLLGCLPAGVEVVRGHVNRVPEPSGADFVVLSPLSRERLSTNTHTYSDGQRAGGTAPSVAMIAQSTEISIQADIHGPQSANNVQIISTLFRDEYAEQAMQGLAVQPLYASDPRFVPFLNGEQQIEYRWTIDLMLQGNVTVTVPQQFADNVVVGIISVDATYPP